MGWAADRALRHAEQRHDDDDGIPGARERAKMAKAIRSASSVREQLLAAGVLRPAPKPSERPCPPTMFHNVVGRPVLRIDEAGRRAVNQNDNMALFNQREFQQGYFSE